MKFSILIFTFLFAVPLVSAQEKSAPQITTKVDLVSLGEDLSGLSLGKARKTVSALAFRYGQTLRYKGTRVIEISQSSKGQNNPREEEEHPDALVPLPPQKLPPTEIDQKDSIAKAIEKRREKNPDLVALAVVPRGARHVTILLAPAANNTYRTFVINDDPTKLSFGKMRVHNFCRHPISMRFNNRKPIVIRPLKSRQEAPKQHNTLSYLLSYPKGKSWKAQESNILRVTPGEQVQMIVLRSRSSFFTSASGSRGGRLQVAVLRRMKNPPKIITPNPKDNLEDPGISIAPTGQ